MAYRLQTLLDLRARAEEDARRSLADATAAHAGALGEQRSLDAAVTSARSKAAAARAMPRSPARAADGAGVGRYLARLQAAVAEARAAADAHRAGPLAAAATAEQAARAAHLEARREIEALRKHRDKIVAAERRQADRRAEAALDDLPRRGGR